LLFGNHKKEDAMKFSTIARVVVIGVSCIIVGYVMLKVFEANCREGLTKTNHELAHLESMTPEKYYQEVREKLILQRDNYEQALK